MNLRNEEFCFDKSISEMILSFYTSYFIFNSVECEMLNRKKKKEKIILIKTVSIAFDNSPLDGE